MCKYFIPSLLIIQLVTTSQIFAQNLAINATGNLPDTSAMLDISSSNRGFLMPRLTTTQINAIVLPAKGLLAYNTTLDAFQVNEGSAASPNWITLGSANGQTISFTPTGDVTGNASGTTTLSPALTIANNAVTTTKISDGNVTNAKLANSTISGVSLGSNLNTLTLGYGLTGSSYNGTAAVTAKVDTSSSATNPATQGYVSRNNWSVSGNSNTIDGTNFIGTTNNVALNFKVNNQKAGRLTSTGNTLFGYQAGNVNNATSNTGFGYHALLADTSGDFNTGIGANALIANLSGLYNTATGVNALYSNTIGNFNTASGVSALLYNTSGSYNTALGMQSMYSNNIGDSNTAVGINSLFYNTSGSYNTAVGLYAGIYNSTGRNNTAIGYQSLYSNNTGSGNVGIGYNCLLNNASGNYNTVIGDSADVSANNLTKATAIGFQATVSCNHCLVLGDTALAGVGIGTKSPSVDLSFGGRSARTIGMERNTIAATAGNNLTIQSGAAAGASSNKNGGDLILSSGISTGTGSSNIYFQTAAASSSGSADNNSSTRMTILGNGNVGIGATVPGEALEVTGNIKTKHIIGSTSAPTYSAGSGAGTSPTIAITGSDVAGKISLTTGTSPSASSNVVTVNFNTAYSTAPYVIITPGNAATAALSATASKLPFVTSTSTGNFIIAEGSVALSASTAYVWYYQVIQ